MVDAIISCGSHTTGILVGETLLMLGGFMALQMRVHKKLVRKLFVRDQVKSSSSQAKGRARTHFSHTFPHCHSVALCSQRRFGDSTCRRRLRELSPPACGACHTSSVLNLPRSLLKTPFCATGTERWSTRPLASSTLAFSSR